MKLIRVARKPAGGDGTDASDAAGASRDSVHLDYKAARFVTALAAGAVEVGDTDGAALRGLMWSAAPVAALRPLAWRLLLGLSPATADRRAKEQQRKFAEYVDYRGMYFRGGACAAADRLPQEQAILTQLGKDLPRHTLSIYHVPATVERLERALFVWSLRNPAASFVQGMDDLFAVFYTCFVAERIAIGRDNNAACLAADAAAARSAAAARRWRAAEDVACGEDHAALGTAIAALSDADLDAVECETYWAAGRMLSWVQHHYTYGQPGIRTSVADIERTVRRFDEELSDAIDALGVGFLQFLMPWVHCFFVRFVSPQLAFRLWDTYLAIGEDFAAFHVFVCAALLLRIRDGVILQPMDKAMPALQNPTKADIAITALHAANGGASMRGSSLLQPSASLATSASDAPAPEERRTVAALPDFEIADSFAALTPTWLETLVAEAFQLKLRAALPPQ
jgi:hypothetical protein